MRSYIFTPIERQIIKKFVEGKAVAGDMHLIQIRHRIKSFETLKDDVDLYLLLRNKLEL